MRRSFSWSSGRDSFESKSSTSLWGPKWLAPRYSMVYERVTRVTKVGATSNSEWNWFLSFYLLMMRSFFNHHSEQQRIQIPGIQKYGNTESFGRREISLHFSLTFSFNGKGKGMGNSLTKSCLGQGNSHRQRKRFASTDSLKVTSIHRKRKNQKIADLARSS